MKVYGCYTNTTPEFTRPPLVEMSRSVKCSGGGIMEELENMGCVQAGDMRGGRYEKMFEESRRVDSSGGISPTVHTAGGGGQELKVMEEPVSCASRGRPTAGGTNQQQIELNGTNANSITTVQKDSMVCEPPKQEKTYRIRALTERECFRLMGVKEEDYQKIASHQSRSSQTHLAGDSIVTTCLMAIFGEMLEDVDYTAKIDEVIESVKERDKQSKILDAESRYKI